MYYFTSYAFTIATTLSSVMTLDTGRPITKTELTSPIPSFPSPLIKMYPQELVHVPEIIPLVEFGGGLPLIIRLGKSLKECDVLGGKVCKEMEGDYCEYIERNLGKPVFTAGPMVRVPDPHSNRLDSWLDRWLNGFGDGSVVYCAFGSECILEKEQFHDLVLGLELVDRPFLAALQPPKGHKTIEAALPEGFEERTKGRGIVYGGWVQQQLILEHPSIGCFVTHCGAGSLSEAMVNKCQIVLIPQAADQFLNSRMMRYELKVGVEVEKRDDGFFTREAVREAITAVMDEGSQVGNEVRANHAKWRDFILKEGVEESYISTFIQDLQQLLRT